MINITILGVLLMCSGAVFGAHLEFANPTREIQVKSAEKKVVVDFEFVNRTQREVKVMKYDAACSCMAISISGGKLTYAPGESGVVRAIYEVGTAVGSIDKVVALWLDGDAAEAPSVMLKMKFLIPAVVKLEPKSLHWDEGGEAVTRVIRVVMNEEQPLHLVKVESTSSLFECSWKMIEDGKVYEVSVKPTHTQTRELGMIRLITDHHEPRHQVHQAFAVVKPPVKGETVKP